MNKKPTYVEPQFLTHFEVGNKKINLIQSLKDHIIRIKKTGSVPIKIDGVWRRFSNLHIIHYELKRINEELERLEMGGGEYVI
jgi:hypothetical protein